jgi:hypothetical protein
MPGVEDGTSTTWLQQTFRRPFGAGCEVAPVACTIRTRRSESVSPSTHVVVEGVESVLPLPKLGIELPCLEVYAGVELSEGE